MVNKNYNDDKNKSKEVKKMPLTSRKTNGTWERSISERGQTVIPKDIREYLDVKGGDSLQWTFNKEGEVVVKPKKKTSIMDSYGILKPTKQVDDIDQAIHEAKKILAKQKHKEGRI